MCVTLCTSVHFVHMEQKIISTTPQHNREHNCAPCPTAPSAHASYKGYGCNNSRPLRTPHPNTIIGVVVLGCGLIQMGEGAAAPFIGCIFWVKLGRRGGLIPWPNYDGRTELDHLSPLGASLCSANRPGDGTAALFVATEIRGNI